MLQVTCHKDESREHLLVPRIEIDQIQRLGSESDSELPGTSALSVIYAICAGEWDLCDSGDEEVLRLHPGDLYLLEAGIPHRLTPTRTGEPSSKAPSALRIPYQSDPPAGGGLPPRLHFRGSRPLDAQDVTEADLWKTIAELFLTAWVSSNLSGLPDAASPRMDPEVTQSIMAMERSPATAWTIQRLAQEVGISRSALAQKFKDQTGKTPSDYLLNIRMRLAEELLRGRREHLKEVARRTGYQSVSAFSTAFKRWSGSPPSVHRRRPLS